MTEEWQQTWTDSRSLTQNAAGIPRFNVTSVALASVSQRLACAACAPGSFKSTNGSAACTLCPQDTYGNESAAQTMEACFECRPATTSDEDSTLIVHCVCLPGFFPENARSPPASFRACAKP